MNMANQYINTHTQIYIASSFNHLNLVKIPPTAWEKKAVFWLSHILIRSCKHNLQDIEIDDLQQEQQKLVPGV